MPLNALEVLLPNGHRGWVWSVQKRLKRSSGDRYDPASWSVEIFCSLFWNAQGKNLVKVWVDIFDFCWEWFITALPL